jgi:CheY-like chemotaxis protein
MGAQNNDGSIHQAGHPSAQNKYPRRRNHQILVVEDDPVFARIVGDIASKKGFKPIIAHRGDVGLAMARQLRPDAILLDVRLPGLDGWSLLDHFKHDPATRHIPVVIVSGDDRRAQARRRGAFHYLLKPISAEIIEATLGQIDAFVASPARRLLLAMGDEARRGEVASFVGDADLQITEVASGAEALRALGAAAFDGLVTEQALPDMTARELVGRIALDEGLRDAPVIVYSEGTPGLSSELGRLTDVVVVREARSLDTLLDATTLFLHRIEDDLSEPKRHLLERLRRADPVLAGKRVLIVDDDQRNVFALKSLLEAQKMDILTAYSGRQGLDVLTREYPVDAVLMDVMMPEMDGYEAIRAIRQISAWRPLPVFALTAKAMKGDRERCIEAGASDYIAKPVDTAQLLSMLRVWLGP